MTANSGLSCVAESGDLSDSITPDSRSSLRRGVLPQLAETAHPICYQIAGVAKAF
jgi:hypothetical protein